MASDPAPPTGFIELADATDFALGDLTVRPALRTIERGERRRVVQPRIMQVLIALAEERPGVVSRDRLLARCWNGRIVGEDALHRCIVMLRVLARELGEAFQVENVARVGYRLVVPGDLAAERASSRAWPPRGLVVLAVILAAAMLTAAAFRSTSLSVALVSLTNPRQQEAQQLYQAGRTMLLTGNPQVAGEARTSLTQALALDPNNAPAWAALAEAVRSEASVGGAEAVVTALPVARGHLRRALALSPDLADAHGELGTLLGSTSIEARRHLRRAAELEPDRAETQIWLAAALRAEGDFVGELAAYRRARAIDPSWYRPTRDLAIATAEMGDRDGGIAVARQAARRFAGCSGPQGRIAWIYGDIAESAACAAASLRTPSIWTAPAQVVVASARLTLGLSSDRRAAAPIHIVDTRPPQGRVAPTAPPSPAAWRFRNRSPDAALAYRQDNLVGAKLMLNAGRQAELVETYRGPTGLLGLSRGRTLIPADLPAAPLVALALQRAGHAGEARDLLEEANRLAERTLARGRVPFSFLADAAMVAATSGQTDRAVALLEDARERGWVNNGWSDLLQLRDEPGFSLMRHDARFEAIARDLDRLYARERARLLALDLAD